MLPCVQALEVFIGGRWLFPSLALECHPKFKSSAKPQATGSVQPALLQIEQAPHLCIMSSSLTFLLPLGMRVVWISIYLYAPSFSGTELILYLGPITPVVDLGLPALLAVRVGVYLPHPLHTHCRRIEF